MQLFYAGGFGRPYSLSLCAYDLHSEKISLVETYKIEDASYICLSNDKKYLYAVIEKNSYKGRAGGAVAAYSVGAFGKLAFLNEAFTESAGPCYISADKLNRYLYAANYEGGTVSVFALGGDGSIGSISKIIDNNSFGIPSRTVSGRQNQAHAHFAAPMQIKADNTADGVFLSETLWILDLGIDTAFALDKTGEKICDIKLPIGAGPRHLVFHPVKPLGYIVCELSGEVYCFEYENTPEGLIASCRASVPVLSSPAEGNISAAIRISPCGKCLLVSNRGPHTDSLSVMKINDNTAVPELTQVKSSGGRCPRDFAFNPSGDRLFCANQESDSITVFKWDDEKGALLDLSAAFNIKKPSCVLFL